MIDFSALISLLITILIFYFTLLFSLNKEIVDLFNNSENTKENLAKINIRRNILKTLKTITVILIVLLLLLYFLPPHNTISTNTKPISLYNIRLCFQKILPFKKGFFSNPHFKFSYITGIILSIFVELVCYGGLESIIMPKFVSEHLLILGILTILGLALVWISNYISLFLTYCISHCFEFLSIILNIIFFIFISSIIYFILDYFS